MPKEKQKQEKEIETCIGCGADTTNELGVCDKCMECSPGELEKKQAFMAEAEATVASHKI